MKNSTFFIYLLILAGTTYLIRVIPFIAIKEKINNRFIRSFLYYIPYAVLTAMTIPAIFYATNWWVGAVAGLLVAVLTHFKTPFSKREKEPMQLLYYNASALFFQYKTYYLVK